MRRTLLFLLLISPTFVGVLGGFMRPVWAHDPGLSAAVVRIGENRVTVHLTYARRELEALVPIDTDQNQQVSPEELARAKPGLRALAGRFLAVSVDDTLVDTRVTRIHVDESDGLHIDLAFPWAQDVLLRLRVPLLAQLALGHRHYVTVRDAEDVLHAEHLLHAKHTSFLLNPGLRSTSAAVAPSWPAFVHFGVEHIVLGYDHLLFLFGLLVMGCSFWNAWRIITSFTIAHSITLALATFEVVHVPSNVVEPLIAASIIYVGVENLFRRDLHRRWLLTFVFGLVHGLGFAAVLRELGLGDSGIEAVAPLFAFNLGVELGQVALAALVLSLLWTAQKRCQYFPRVATACSVLLVIAGTYWFVERTVWS